MGDRYVTGEEIGRGGFGVVYRASHSRTGQAVAIKVLHVDAQDDRDEAVQRFVKEGRVLARLQHPATVRIFDVGTTPSGAPYIAMEFVDGPNLEQALAHLSAHQYGLSEAQGLDIMMPVLSSLSEAHGLGLVHRDLKPANVLLTEVGDEPLVVKVADFGVVRTQGSQLTSRHSSIGTPKYMSPEQCRGDAVDARSDLYSLGCVLFEAVTAVAPFDSDNLINTMYQQMSSPVPDPGAAVSAPFREVLQRAMAKEPADRFTTASEMGAALRKIRVEMWPDVPTTPLHKLLRVAPGTARRIIGSGDGRHTREPTVAGVRRGVRDGARAIQMVAEAPDSSVDTEVDGSALGAAVAAALADHEHNTPQLLQEGADAVTRKVPAWGAGRRGRAKTELNWGQAPAAISRGDRRPSGKNASD